MRIQLIEDWWTLAKKAWSIRLAIASAVLTAAEVAVPYVAPQTPSGLFAAGAGLLSLAAAWARLVSQPKMRDEISAKQEARADAAAG